MSNAKWSFAFLEDRETLVKIGEAPSGKWYYCPNCGQRMYATHGPIKEDHFRHDNGECSYDDYLHKAAESCFYNEFKACREQGKSYLLEYKYPIKCHPDCIKYRTNCPKKICWESIDLADRFTKAYLEKSVATESGYRRPDILLEADDGSQLWVEIWVNHKTDDEKLREGNVLEIRIKAEKDIELLQKRHLIESEQVNYYPLNLTPRICDTPVFPRKSLLEQTAKNPVTMPSKQRGTDQRLNIFNSKSLQNNDLNDSLTEEMTTEELKWIDLGLPSRTLWASIDSGCMTFPSASEKFMENIPSSEQYFELRSLCSCKWESSTIARFTGPNGNSIRLKGGWYWLNDIDGSIKQTQRRDSIHLFYGGQGLVNDKELSSTLRVRLVKKEKQ